MGVGASLKVITLGFVAKEEDDWELAEALTAVGILSHERFFWSDLELEAFATVEASVCCLLAPCLSFSPDVLGFAFSEEELPFGSLELAFGCT